ncbi:hypothetical protein FSS13T_20940 [Flavobacterium saliperosum S13]|uniref:Uncharacterized protein n=2 Tax=Flavobacterium saliperosum TaxID=329186 RepID=A0A1G4VR42_9FLAO|nr:hypothetical protein [Flavobacterium saliperosum]ESU24121.1 hypothetical protein FSS13T_20940 [Flavobacterium saliperosum S13]SCX10619.1 hypothetical protein SAMN02927925_01608 [Flavobacterium saliperosum]
MKNAIVIIVFLFVMKPILPVLEYVLNYDYIVKELCENKAKPETNCNGKCHLMKELAKASENNTPVSSEKKVSHSEFEVLFIQKLASLEVVTLNFPIQKAINTKYSDGYFYENSTTTFHPPTV